MQGIPGLDVIEGFPKSTLRSAPPSLKTFEAATRGLRPPASAAPVVPTPMGATANALGGGAVYNDAPNRAAYVANQAKLNAAAFPAPTAPEPKPTAGFLRRQLDTAGSVASKAGSAAGAGLRAVGGVTMAAAPAVFGNAARSLTNRAADASAGAEVPGVPDQVAPGQIPGAAPGMVAPAAVPGDVLRDTELGRNVGNAINALGPVAAPLGQITRGAATLAPKAAAAVTGGTAALRGFAAPEVAAAAVQPQSAPATVTPPSSSTQNSAAAVAAEMAGRRGANRDFVAPAPAALENNITRSGNSYSGENIRAGATINGGPGRGTVTSLDTGEGFRQNLLELQRNAAERAGAPAPSAAGGFGGATLSSALRDKANSAPAEPPPGLSAQQTAAWRQQNASLAQAKEIADAQIANAAAGTAQTGRIAEMNNATLRDSNALTNATRMQGDKLDFAAKMAPIEVQRQQREQTAALLRANRGDPAAAAQAALAAGRVDLAEALSKPVTTLQEQAGKRDGLQKSAWDDIRTGITAMAPNPGKDGNPEVSKAMEERAFARFKRSNPEGYNLQGAERQKALQTAMADEELMAVFEKPSDGGFSSMLPLRMDSPTRKMNDLPPAAFFKGARLGEQVGALRGAVSPNLSKGDQILDLGAGRQAVNVGNLSAGALSRLQSLIDEANGQTGK